MIELLVIEGCPSAAQTDALLHRVLAEEGLHLSVITRVVTTTTEALALQFPGSPTVRVNGQDIESARPAEPGGVLSCRLYRTAHGLSAVPPEDIVRAAVRTLKRPGDRSRKELLASGMAAGAAWLLALGPISAAHAGETSELTDDGPMTGARLAGILRSERAGLLSLLAEVGPDRMELTGVDSTWSVKQVVAHLTWYDQVIVEGARQLGRGGTFAREGLRALSLDERNAVIAAESGIRPPAEIIAESDRVFGQLLALIASCPDAMLNDPRRLGLPDDVVPWMLVANNSYLHYREHVQAIRNWLATIDRPVKTGGIDAETGQ